MEQNLNETLLKYVLAELSDLKEREGSDSSYSSPETNKLCEALAKAQGEMEMAKEDSSNPFFKSKYADLSSVVKASRPYLAKNGLSVTQAIIPAPQGSYLASRLMHSSGQWIESKVLIEPAKKDVQSLGSYITYLRRYSYSALVGVVASDEDDDGQRAMADSRKGASKIHGLINKDQLASLSEELNGEEELLDMVLKSAEIAKLSDLQEGRYTKAIAWVRDQKAKKRAFEQ